MALTIVRFLLLSIFGYWAARLGSPDYSQVAVKAAAAASQAAAQSINNDGPTIAAAPNDARTISAGSFTTPAKTSSNALISVVSGEPRSPLSPPSDNDSSVASSSNGSEHKSSLREPLLPSSSSSSSLSSAKTKASLAADPTTLTEKERHNALLKATRKRNVVLGINFLISTWCQMQTGKLFHLLVISTPVSDGMIGLTFPNRYQNGQL
jgi:hypothetical protein